MLITQLKSMDDILSFAKGKSIIISCEGCKEVEFPETEAAAVHNEMLANEIAISVIVTDYVCNPENLELQMQKHLDKLSAADTILVFSCGVGVQTVAEKYTDKPVFAACDTYSLPGKQGVTPLEYGCEQCGECHLNETGGICPIVACAKSLVNGQCGGAKNGNCEVEKDMECGWERIHRRRKQQTLAVSPQHHVKLRNYTA